MSKRKSIELLAPARNLECGLEAVRHGADAVYIGAPRFGARAAAGNSIDDIAELVRYAHIFGVRIYVTLNTLLHDDELSEAQALINNLAAINVDALITQDPRILPNTASAQGGFPALTSPIPLHSSTQMDNRTIDDVRTRLEAGYEQTVLARELSLDDIRAIHAAVPEMVLEAFVHGALCVSYSGRCYASEYCFQRSANRGECAQFCRLPFSLIDADNGKMVYTQPRHLLSLRDMNRSADLEAMMDAGISSFKIEGRLKDVSYVKNTTAYYRQRINDIIARRPDDFCRASYGHSTITFTPDLQRSFNRGFTDYFLHGRTSDMANNLTPKSIGQPIGSVSNGATASSRIPVHTHTPLANGDGLCFINSEDQLQGFRVNRVEATQNPSVVNIIPHPSPLTPAPRPGTQLFRNYDADFERQLARPTAQRHIDVRWTLTDAVNDLEGFSLTLTILETGQSATAVFPLAHELARTPQSEAICRQLCRLGDTPYSCTPEDITITTTDNWFIPASTLAAWRREVIASLTTNKPPKPKASRAVSVSGTSVANNFSRHIPLMTCRYCIRYELGACLRHDNANRLPRRLALRLADGRTFPLHFDCQRCEMQVLAPDK